MARRRGGLAKGFGISLYLVVAAAALFRSVEYQKRLVTAFLAAYASLVLTSIVFPLGPFAQAGVVTLPIFVLVLLGARPARVAIVASAMVILLAPLLRLHPRIAQLLVIGPAQAALSPAVVWMHVLVQMAILCTLMVLVDQFHGFLLETLNKRIAAQEKMEHEIRERQRLEREIADVSDAERRRLSQDLHDGACQLITAALLHAQVLAGHNGNRSELSKADFQPLMSLLTSAIGDVKNVARGLCPLDPDPEALAAALRALARRTREMAVRCEFTMAGDVRIPQPTTAQHLYRIAQEAVSNALRHAHPSRVSIELRRSTDELLLEVTDDGVGLPTELPTGGMGLHTMEYRARLLEGELRVAPAPGRGVRVTCRIPHLAAPPPALDHSEGQRWIPGA